MIPVGSKCSPDVDTVSFGPFLFPDESRSVLLERRRSIFEELKKGVTLQVWQDLKAARIKQRRNEIDSPDYLVNCPPQCFDPVQPPYDDRIREEASSLGIPFLIDRIHRDTSRDRT
ncbi:hypothetical protein [Haloarcula marina]|uniref:hypothetical protein n=1 Tax=Haloarcula marina TaxID=2961574 RepID=UPI0020B65B53|nr:hypothetical protein [Halomicroarcula marina]